MKHNKAFTLLEILIAATISSIVMLGLYSAFQSGILTYDRIESSDQTYRTARVILQKLEHELKNSFCFKSDDCKFSGTADTLDFYSSPDIYLEAKKFPYPASISYSLENNILKKAVLAASQLISAPQSPEPQEIAGDIGEINFQFAEASQDNSVKWQDSWAKESEENQKKTLPAALKIKLVIKEKKRNDREGKTAEFSTVIDIPAASQETAQNESLVQ